MHNMDHNTGLFSAAEFILATPFLLAFIIYLSCIVISNRNGRPWPFYRTAFWVSGCFISLIAVAGPLADLAHADFRMHMVTHLFLGMLGPLLLALGAPVTLLLRTLSAQKAKRFTSIFRSDILGFLSNPVVTSTLNIGGLWVLYTTDLFGMMHENTIIHILVHAHVFLAGYLFTVSMIYIDPIPHRRSYVYRSISLVLALAAHGILSKHIYAYPPNGVPQHEAEIGGMIMYYGGDAVDLMIIIILCYHWYKAAKPKENQSNSPVNA